MPYATPSHISEYFFYLYLSVCRTFCTIASSCGAPTMIALSTVFVRFGDMHTCHYLSTNNTLVNFFLSYDKTITRWLLSKARFLTLSRLETLNKYFEVCFLVNCTCTTCTVCVGIVSSRNSKLWEQCQSWRGGAMSVWRDRFCVFAGHRSVPSTMMWFAVS